MNLADKETRFGNYVIDSIGFISILIIHAFILDGLLHIIPAAGSPLLAFYFLFLYFGYYFLFEYFFNKTPGKFLTKTIVIDENDNKPSAKAIALRSVSRLIPFDNLSFLFSNKGWHDDLSKTKVIYVHKKR
jgi:uncharacterized RDD family membrane protein YckC